MATKAVLLDLDGTLLDTAGDLVAAVNRLLLKHHRSPLSLGTLRPYVSQGGLRLICEAFSIAEDSEFAIALRAEYLTLYRNNLSIHTKLFHGMDRFLTSLEKSGIPWGIVTNKPEWLTLPLLTEVGLTQRAACVIGGDTLTVSKPSPAPVLYACEQIGIAPSDTLMIGDDKRDIDSGAAAGTLTVAAGWGYIQPADNLSLWQADYCFDSVEALHAWFH